MASVLGLQTAVEITYQDRGDVGVEVGPEAEEEKVPVKGVSGRGMNI